MDLLTHVDSAMLKQNEHDLVPTKLQMTGHNGSSITIGLATFHNGKTWVKLSRPFIENKICLRYFELSNINVLDFIVFLVQILKEKEFIIDFKEIWAFDKNIKIWPGIPQEIVNFHYTHETDW